MSSIIQGRGDSILNLDNRQKDDLGIVRADHLFLLALRCLGWVGLQHSLIKQRREHGATKAVGEALEEDLDLARNIGAKWDDLNGLAHAANLRRATDDYVAAGEDLKTHPNPLSAR